MTTRRHFLLNSGLLLTAGTILSSIPTLKANTPASPRTQAKLQFGIASHSLRHFKFDEMLNLVLRVGIDRIAVKSVHVPLNSSDSQLIEFVQKAKQKGIEIYGAGTIYMKNEQEVEQAYHYAKTAGLKIIIGSPNFELLKLCEKKSIETGVILAIHNHGASYSIYPSPLDAYERIKNLDKKIGLCMDIGHTMLIGQDVCEVAEKVIDRLYDVHIKDIPEDAKPDSCIEIGRGIIDIPNFLKTMMKLEYKGTLNIEFENYENDPLPGIAECVGYLNGVMRMLNTD